MAKDVSESCIICSEKVSTREHIVPRWIQKSFNLSNQKLRLSNNTDILYKQALIPLCKNCNGNVLSRLENRVQQGTASEMDYYLWALKMRFCLSIKDSTLLLDRANPSKGVLLKKENAFVGAEFIRHSLMNFERKDFHFNPRPFGSVFLFDNPLSDGEFGLADVPAPHWGLTITLPEKKILSVLFTDRGLVKKEILRLSKSKGGLNRFFLNSISKSSSITARIVMLKMLLWQYRFSNIPYGVSLKDNGIVSARVPNRVNYRKNLKRETLISITRFLDFPIEVATSLHQSLTKEY